jgi:hypothetical protein
MALFAYYARVTINILTGLPIAMMTASTVMATTSAAMPTKQFIKNTHD